jgi:hypothetical protein
MDGGIDGVGNPDVELPVGVEFRESLRAAVQNPEMPAFVEGSWRLTLTVNRLRRRAKHAGASRLDRVVRRLLGAVRGKG